MNHSLGLFLCVNTLGFVSFATPGRGAYGPQARRGGEEPPDAKRRVVQLLLNCQQYKMKDLGKDLQSKSKGYEARAHRCHDME